jgi:hypothetical protein
LIANCLLPGIITKQPIRMPFKAKLVGEFLTFEALCRQKAAINVSEIPVANPALL